jgi:hypothetical protein
MHTSKLKSTPPIGAPNATEIPAAAAADNTSRFLALENLVSGSEMKTAAEGTYLHFC